MVQSDIHTDSSREVLQAGLTGTLEDLLLVNPTQDMICHIVNECREDDSPTATRLLVDEKPLKNLTDDFLIASTLADLIDDGVVAVRTLGSVPRHSLLLTPEYTISLVENESTVAGLTTTEQSFVADTYEEYERRWETAEEFSLRTPPLSHIRETLEEDIGPEAVEDFDRVLDTLETARGDGEGLDEVTIALLVAAYNGELLYDISRWGEDIRLASKATFSRNKNRLEEAGLIDTEKVPIDVGRPRLRLLLANSGLQNSDIEEVAQRAEQKLGQ